METLDKIETRVVNKLRKGAVIITDSDYPTATISGSGADFEISGAAFFRMVQKGVLYQDNSKNGRFDYKLHAEWK